MKYIIAYSVNGQSFSFLYTSLKYPKRDDLLSYIFNEIGVGHSSNTFILGITTMTKEEYKRFTEI